ncbi:carboxypeptidase-like regulatory domain-containing protein [Geotalea toluenoxydans]
MKKLVQVITLSVVVVIAAVTIAQEPATGTLSGRWVWPQKDLAGDGYVHLFNVTNGPPPLPESYWRVPDGTFPIEGDGRFTVEAPAGSYFLGGMKRLKGKGVGPLSPGDVFFLKKDENGKPFIHIVKAGEKANIGTFTDGVAFKGTLQKGATAIEGTVADRDGKPVEGVLILAYANREMRGRPLFVSTKTDRKGNYRLGLHQGGTYYLKIRDFYGGGRPQEGQILGFYGSGEAAPVLVTTGAATKEIDIVGNRFAGRGNASP